MAGRSPKEEESSAAVREAVLLGGKNAAIAGTVVAVPTLVACRVLPWAKHNLNYTAQALIISAVIWPESRSFDDNRYGPVPARWKGKCQTGQEFNATSCNRKIIGARWYGSGISAQVLKRNYNSPRDITGHGTHVASTIAGVEVRGVSYGGLGTGVARGGAPRARLGIYKVCWASWNCPSAAILAAIDDAIHDGVDVLSISIGGAGHEIPGTLHDVQRGISVVFGGGNDGPVPQTVTNAAPWVTTVAASTIDRAFPTLISLGTKKSWCGTTLSEEEQGDKYLDAERGEEDEYEEGVRGQEDEEGEEGGQGEDVEEGEHPEGEEGQKKGIWTHGPAGLPPPPTIENDKLEDYYKVSARTDQHMANRVLQLMAKKNLKDTWYNARNLAISHYYAKKGERRNKDRVVKEGLTIENDTAWERICPKWYLHKKASWMALVAANGGQEIHRLTVWQKAHEKKDPVGGAVTYYGKRDNKVDNYKKAFKALHGADSDPLSEPVDETVVMIAGGGQPHGRPAILSVVHKPTISLPRIRHITSSSGMPMPPRPCRSTQSFDDARIEEAYEQVQVEFQQKMQEYEEAAMAFRRHGSKQTKALFLAMRTGAQPPEYVDPPVVPPAPRLPTKQEFFAQFYDGTLVSALPYY
ncbi:hypothetical protein ACQ4PT_022994 [Festuca glaucescens]